MLERFLVPLDMTANSARILPLVTSMAQRMAQPVTLLAVVPDGISETSPLADDPERSQARAFFESRRNLAQTYLDGVSRQLRKDRVWATSRVETGPEAETILSAAATHEIGMIAMSTHGRVGPQ